jgi:hypothetical protein
VDYTKILQHAQGATKDTLQGDFLPKLFSEMCDAGLLATEAETVFLALKEATGVSLGALRTDWKKFLALHDPAPTGQGTTVLFTEPEPWPEEVDGVKLLDHLAAFYSRYLVLPEGAPETLSLWTFHTYSVDATHITPRLGVLSPQKRCGKTTLLAILGACSARPLPASNITPSALFRSIEKWQPTLLIDEADTFLPDNPELRGVLNAGHTRGGTVVRTVGDDHEPRAFTVFAPTAIALISKLPTTLADRAILIKMRRKLKTESVEPLRLDKLDTTDLRRQCQRWAHDNLDALRVADPDLPATLHDRAKDNWRPLVAIADVAGGNWPELARKAIVALTSGQLDEEEAAVLLLEDLYHIFTEGKLAAITCKELAIRLHDREERPWRSWGRQEKPINSRQMGVILRPFGIIAKTVHPKGQPAANGYTFAQCADAFARYLPFQTVQPCTGSNDAATKPSQTVPHDPAQTVQPCTGSNDADFDEEEPCSGSNEALSTVSTNFTPASINGVHGCTVLEENPGTVSTARIPASMNGVHGCTVSTTPREEETSPTVVDTWPTIPCALCGGTERWNDEGTLRCVRCWPPGPPAPSNSAHAPDGGAWDEGII